MKVLFIQPPYQTHVVNPPLGMGYLMSYLRMKGHNVSLIDLNLRHRSREKIASMLREVSPDIVGVSVMCTGAPTVKSIVEIVKSTIRVPVMVGGAQASALPEHTLIYTGADFAVIGEGEETTAELVSFLESGKDPSSILGLAINKGGIIKVNKRRPLIEDLDSLPFPAWDLMPPKKYRIAPYLARPENTR